MRVDVDISLGLEVADETAIGGAIARLYELLTDSAADALVGEPAADLSWTLRRLLTRLPEVDEVLEHHVTVGYGGGESNVSGGRRPGGPDTGPRSGGGSGPGSGGRPGDAGGSGVREPRRPSPAPPSLAAVAPLDD